MTDKYIYTSLTRISDLESGSFSIRPLTKNQWESGDYVLCEIKDKSGSNIQAELTSGRMMELMRGDLLVGALGIRHATLEITGTWKAVEKDGIMHLLTGAGLMGKATSKSAFITNHTELQYLGHVMAGNKKRNMRDYVPAVPAVPFRIPTVLLVGTSMSAGKRRQRESSPGN